MSMFFSIVDIATSQLSIVIPPYRLTLFTAAAFFTHSCFKLDKTHQYKQIVTFFNQLTLVTVLYLHMVFNLQRLLWWYIYCYSSFYFNMEWLFMLTNNTTTIIIRWLLCGYYVVCMASTIVYYNSWHYFLFEIVFQNN